MCQELPVFAFVYMCLGAGEVSLNFVTVTLELFPWLIVLFFGYCFGEIVCIWNSYVY
jgi:hypothetical protein